MNSSLSAGNKVKLNLNKTLYRADMKTEIKETAKENEMKSLYRMWCNWVFSSHAADEWRRMTRKAMANITLLN